MLLLAKATHSGICYRKNHLRCLTTQLIFVNLKTTYSCCLKKYRFDFFPHWSWIVSNKLIEEFTCICFHSTPLPYGRGGSPIQNMVLNGHQTTQVVALKMTNQLDAGPIYLRQDVSLLGGGEEVFRRIYLSVISMMKKLLHELPTPMPQIGDVTLFERRKKEQSNIDMNDSIEHIFDKIRVLDVDGYPPAYIDVGKYRLIFSHPIMRLSGDIEAHVRIQKHND